MTVDDIRRVRHEPVTFGRFLLWWVRPIGLAVLVGTAAYLFGKYAARVGQ